MLLRTPISSDGGNNLSNLDVLHSGLIVDFIFFGGHVGKSYSADAGYAMQAGFISPYHG